MAGHRRKPRTGELSLTRLAAAATPEARFTAAADLVRTAAARLARSRDLDAAGRARALLEEATAHLLRLAKGVTGSDR
jgi:hypothetical protein